MKITREIAECVGLWLAEGNNKCHNEITFTNNCYDLILHFDDILSSLFDVSNKRLYVYSAPGQKYEKNNVLFRRIKKYEDVRARKPYYIWRLASVEKMKSWKKLVEETLSAPEHYADILRGFFAGEGNVKTGLHSNRTLRIAQKCEKSWINGILKHLSISYSFFPKNRSYDITGRWNWNIFAERRLADLHPDKRERFWAAYGDFKQEHYGNHYLRTNLLLDLNKPKTTKSLASKYKRSPGRITEILSEFKKNGIIKKFRAQSVDYWVISQSPIVVISRIKKRCLAELNNDPKSVSELSKSMNRSQRAIGKRLSEMQKLGLVERDKFNKWTCTPNISRIIVK